MLTVYAEQLVNNKWRSIAKSELLAGKNATWILFHEKSKHINGKNISFFYLTIEDLKTIAAEALLSSLDSRLQIVKKILAMFENTDPATAKRIIYLDREY